MLVIVGLVVFITFIGIGIIVPLFPFFGERIGASPETITLAVAVGAFGQLISTPFWGWLSDRIGRKPVLLCRPPARWWQNCRGCGPERKANRCCPECNGQVLVISKRPCKPAKA